jgi:glycosyltransferase involved in cell wall biosynthesis
MSLRPAHICVLIPARNEEDLLPACLHSVRKALAQLPAGITSDLIVAVDSSTDRTWEIALKQVAAIGSVIRTAVGVVGAARSVAAAAALRRYRGPMNRCWLANTDADCVVPRHWLTGQLLLASEGIDAIAGTVNVLDFSEHEAIVEERFHQTYLIGDDGTHSHVHAANLGVRANRYLQAGGWSPLATGEDHDLWQRLSSQPIRKASVNGIRVTTSGRRVGRAPHGFAEALAAHNEHRA